jgi:hypothetical protein
MESRTLDPREPEYYVRGLWNIAPDLLTTRLKGHNTQVTEYSWFQLYMLHLVGRSPDSSWMANWCLMSIEKPMSQLVLVPNGEW